MATTSLWPIHNAGAGAVKSIIKRVVDYAENEEKTVERTPAKENPSENDPRLTLQSVMSYVSDKNEGLKFVTGINCTAEHAVEEMMITKRRWPDKGNRILYHGYQSFLPGEVTPEQAHRLGVKLAEDLWSERFEIVVATHLDREHLHNHFVINAMSFVDGTKFIWDEEYPRMQVRSDELCRGENLSVVPPNKDNEATRRMGGIQAGKKGAPTIESIVKEDVDSCIAAASSLQEWFRLMKDKGYQVDDSRKYLRVFPYGHSKCIRIDRRFGLEYSMEGLEERILSHGPVVEQDTTREADQEQELYREMSVDSRNGKRTNTKHQRRQNDPIYAVKARLTIPVGIQITYIRFIVRMGYRRTPAQIARIHYLYREELTRLDHYISEIKFLIYEDIRTEGELRSRMETEQKDITQWKKDIQNLKYRIRAHPEEQESLQPILQKTASFLKEAKENHKYCRNILARMETMHRKEEMANSLMSVGELQKVQRREERKREQLEIMGQDMEQKM